MKVCFKQYLSNRTLTYFVAIFYVTDFVKLILKGKRLIYMLCQWSFLTKECLWNFPLIWQAIRAEDIKLQKSIFEISHCQQKWNFSWKNNENNNEWFNKRLPPTNELFSLLGGKMLNQIRLKMHGINFHFLLLLLIFSSFFRSQMKRKSSKRIHNEHKKLHENLIKISLNELLLLSIAVELQSFNLNVSM